MNLNYAQRMELLRLVREERHKHWEELTSINARFKNENMEEDERDYWLKEQSKAYDKEQILAELKDRLMMSV